LSLDSISTSHDPAELVVLVGPAGAGKSTWAHAQYLPNEIVSSDSLRAVVGIGEADMAASDDAFAMLFAIVQARLARRLTTVVDSTALDRSFRDRLCGCASAHGVRVVAVLFDTPAAQCRQQNAARDRRVPAAVITIQLRQYKDARAAIPDEGFDEVRYVVAAPSTPAVRAVAENPAEAHQTTESTSMSKPTKLRFGLHLSSFPWPAAELRMRLAEVAQAAEAAGFDSIWAMDHFRQIPQVGREWDDLPEVFGLLSAVAAVTTRVTVGPLVAAVSHRNLGVLGKQVATLDVLSGGRAICGLGLGWHKEEHHAYGIEFPSTAERYELLEDALQFLPVLWGPGNKPFVGRRYSAAGAMCYPRPLQAHIPILVGGSGERRTLRLVAQYADACNLFGEPSIVERKVRVLHEHATAVGRDPAAIRVTHLSSVIVGRTPSEASDMVAQLRIPPKRVSSFHPGSIQTHVERVSSLQAAGVTDVIVSMPNPNPDTIATFAEVIQASLQ
jgi:alkanesulfonate monooxygenase SsuD/methylene tetrahydromethanopterin reductase-like flavin-dependent oxidoreductase (luciferase family)/predicted kinase